MQPAVSSAASDPDMLEMSITPLPARCTSSWTRSTHWIIQGVLGAALCEKWDTLSCWRGGTTASTAALNGVSEPLLQPVSVPEGAHINGTASPFNGAHSGIHTMNGEGNARQPPDDVLGEDGMRGSTAEECQCLPAVGEGRHCACVADHGLVGPCSCPEGTQFRQQKANGRVTGAAGQEHRGHGGHNPAQDTGDNGDGRKGDGLDGCPGPAALLHSDADRREFISAGAAAGLAVRNSLPPPQAVTLLGDGEVS